MRLTRHQLSHTTTILRVSDYCRAPKYTSPHSGSSDTTEDDLTHMVRCLLHVPHSCEYAADSESVFLSEVRTDVGALGIAFTRSSSGNGDGGPPFFSLCKYARGDPVPGCSVGSRAGQWGLEDGSWGGDLSLNCIRVRSMRTSHDISRENRVIITRAEQESQIMSP